MSTLPARSGYPELIYFVDPGSGPNVVLVGRKYNGSNSRGGAWTDAAFGLGSFTSLNVPEPGRDYFGSLISGTTIGGAFSSPIDANTDSLFFCKYNAANNTMSGKVNLATAPDGIAGNVRYRYTSNGNNMFVMWYQNTTGAYAMRYKTSSDGGSTWSSIGALQQVNGIGHVVNGDTCSSWFGMDAVYKPGTTNWCAVWSTLFPTATGQTAGYAQGCKILFSSPGINGGNPVEVAGRINMPIISDTNLFYNRAALQVGVTPVSHPSIAWSSNGSRVVVAFSAFQPGDSADGFAFNDIWMTYSDNGGLNWATPVNLTNTHDWDELYPTLSEVGNTPTSFTVKFQATKGPGSSSFSNNAPVYRVYHVVKTFNPQSIGIKEIASETPKSFSLHQNYPNPFNPVTTIRFDISKNSRVTLKVFDITGKEVSSLLNNELISKGTKEIVFDASSLPSGAYFYTLSTDNFKETRKMLLIK